jgi:broad specificity phosphatase PhoE
MGNLYFVRHGQASFGADDYDQLSELGSRQSVRLGEYLAEKGLQFEAVYTGSLKRHIQTYGGIQTGMATLAPQATALVTPCTNSS